MVFRQLWALHIVQISDRKGIGSFYIDTRLGAFAFAKLTEEEQQLLKLKVVGGFQTEKRKANWSEETEGNCIFCGLADTAFHRFLECKFFQQISMLKRAKSGETKEKNGFTFHCPDCMTRFFCFINFWKGSKMHIFLNQKRRMRSP